MNPQVAASANPTPFNVNLPGAGTLFTDTSGSPTPQLYSINGNNLQQFNVSDYTKSYLSQNGIDASALAGANGRQLGLGPNGTTDSSYNASLASMYQKAQSLGVALFNNANNWGDAGAANIDYYKTGTSLLNKNYGVNISSLSQHNIGDVLSAIQKQGGSLSPTTDASFFGNPQGAASSVTLNGPGSGAAPNPTDIAASQAAQTQQLAGVQNKNVVTQVDANGNITSSSTQPLNNGPSLDVMKQQLLGAQDKLTSLGAPPMTSIGSTVTPPTNGGGSGPTLPNPTGASTAAQYVTGIAATLQSQQQQLQDAYQQQQQNYQTKIDALNTQNKELQALEDNGMAGELSTTTQETAQKQAALDQEQKAYQENYDANQSLIGEMDGLLTQGNQIIENMQNTTGLASIMNPRIAKTMSDITARTGVIQAVLAARNDQIGVAQNQLKSSLDAITSISNDQLNYYKSVVSFYDNQKSDNTAEITKMSADQKTYVDGQIKSIQDNITQTQQTASIIQKAMLDPTQALAFAKAGVTLNDSVEQINAKLATYAQSQALQWTTPQLVGGDYIQTNKITGETRTVVSNATTPGQPNSGDIVSGTLTYTKEDKAADSQALESSRGSDGYVDPSIYQTLYTNWTHAGGTAAGFLTTYPPKDYVNPANTWLPSVLMPKGSSRGGVQTP